MPPASLFFLFFIQPGFLSTKTRIPPRVLLIAGSLLAAEWWSVITAPAGNHSPSALARSALLQRAPFQQCSFQGALLLSPRPAEPPPSPFHIHLSSAFWSNIFPVSGATNNSNFSSLSLLRDTYFFFLSFTSSHGLERNRVIGVCHGHTFDEDPQE